MTTQSPPHTYNRLAWSFTATFTVAAIGALATRTSVHDWYPLLNKPSWTPSDTLFGPIWTLLYLLMAVAAWLVAESPDSARAFNALKWYGAQLLLNGLWAALFFGMRSPAFALIDVAVLWLLVVVTTVNFFRVRPVAGVLMIPYLLWTSYAAALNFAIWHLNAG